MTFVNSRALSWINIAGLFLLMAVLRRACCFQSNSCSNNNNPLNVRQSQQCIQRKQQHQQIYQRNESQKKLRYNKESRFVLSATSSQDLKNQQSEGRDDESQGNKRQAQSKTKGSKKAKSSKKSTSKSSKKSTSKSSKKSTSKSSKKSTSKSKKGKKGEKTSSAKKSKTAKESTSRNTVARLSRAAKAAAAKRQKEKEGEIGAKKKTSVDDDDDYLDDDEIFYREGDEDKGIDPDVPSIDELEEMIDAELAEQESRYHSVNSDSIRALYPMEALWDHNDQVLTKKTSPAQQSSSQSLSTAGSRMQQHLFNVAVVLGKPLMNGQLSLEYASRIQHLVFKLMESEENNGIGDATFMDRPQVIYFCGPDISESTLSDNKKSSSTPKRDETAILGYNYFMYLCDITGISLEGIEIRLIPVLQNGLLPVVRQLEMANFFQKWIHDKTQNTKINRMFIHFILISSEYHLCVLNDTHARSPKQSWLEPLNEILNSMKATKHMFFQAAWSFEYSTYPFQHHHLIEKFDGVIEHKKSKQLDTISFLGTWYRRIQELKPVISNLRGIVDNTEFFQRDNFRVLENVRISLARELEDLSEFKFRSIEDPRKDGTVMDALYYRYTVFNKYCTERQARGNIGVDDDDIDEEELETLIMISQLETIELENPKYPYTIFAAMEFGLLSLGRCNDLVDPAGRLVRSVSQEHWIQALGHLEHGVALLEEAWDQDVPFPKAKWEDVFFINEEEFIAAAEEAEAVAAAAAKNDKNNEGGPDNKGNPDDEKEFEAFFDLLDKQQNNYEGLEE